MAQSFKYTKPSSQIDDFAFLKSGSVYTAHCKGLFQSDGKQVNFVIEELEFLFKTEQDKALKK